MVKFIIPALLILASWEDHPDIQDFREQDRIFRLAQIQSGAAECEPKIEIENAKMELANVQK